VPWYWWRGRLCPNRLASAQQLVQPALLAHREVGEALRAHGASATVVVPHWPGKQWWPMLCPDGVHFDSLVIDWRELVASPGLFASGWHSGNTAGCKMPGYRFFALRMSFKASESAERPRSTCTMEVGLCSRGQPRQAARASRMRRFERLARVQGTR
jgi:hypothetical protein